LSSGAAADAITLGSLSLSLPDLDLGLISSARRRRIWVYDNLGKEIVLTGSDYARRPGT